MYVVMMYDIGQVDDGGAKRLNQILKIGRRYLHHTQKSVLEGELSEGLYKALKKEIHMVVDDKKDFVLLFHVANKNNMVRECVGREYDPTHNIF